MKPDLSARLERARTASEAHWTEDRARAVQDHIERRFEQRRRRAVAARVAAVVMLASGFTAGSLWWTRDGERTGPVAQPSQTLRDGSVIVLLDPNTEVRTATETDDRTVIALDRGRAEFRVTRDRPRLFRVEAGSVAVEVTGTVFSVERRDPIIRVQVMEGRVRVLHEEWSGELAAGSEWSAPRNRASPASASPIEITGAAPGAVAAPAAIPQEAAASGTTEQAAPPSGRTDWRELTRRGQFQQAHDALRSSPPPEDAGDLLLAADAARLSHHPTEAVGYLRTLLDTRPADPRRALAAFTMGKVLLDDLGKPLEAARAFAETQTLDSHGALAEDALAREVEAYWKALDEPQAKERAERYLRRYPHGRRTRLVRRFGGME